MWSYKKGNAWSYEALFLHVQPIGILLTYDKDIDTIDLNYLVVE